MELLKASPVAMRLGDGVALVLLLPLIVYTQYWPQPVSALVLPYVNLIASILYLAYWTLISFVDQDFAVNFCAFNGIVTFFSVAEVILFAARIAVFSRLNAKAERRVRWYYRFIAILAALRHLSGVAFGGVQSFREKGTFVCSLQFSNPITEGVTALAFIGLTLVSLAVLVEGILLVRSYEEEQIQMRKSIQMSSAPSTTPVLDKPKPKKNSSIHRQLFVIYCVLASFSLTVFASAVATVSAALGHKLKIVREVSTALNLLVSICLAVVVIRKLRIHAATVASRMGDSYKARDQSHTRGAVISKTKEAPQLQTIHSSRNVSP